MGKGIYEQMKNSGNVVTYNRGDFSVDLLRKTFNEIYGTNIQEEEIEEVFQPLDFTNDRIIIL